MRDYVVRRLLLIVPIMLGVSFLTFLVFRVIPGDAAIFYCTFSCTDEILVDIREELGLDRPWYEQYGDWLGGTFEGGLGTSFFTHVPVTEELGRRLPITGELLIMTIILALVLGIPPGILSAVRPGTAIDWAARVTSVL